MDSLEEVHKICHQQAIVGRGLECVKLVYGIAGEFSLSVIFLPSACFNCAPLLTSGVGKSHYIRQQLMRSSRSVTIAVNEGFEPLKTIQRLHSLPKHQRYCAIYFNFNLIPPVGVSMQQYIAVTTYLILVLLLYNIV